MEYDRRTYKRGTHFSCGARISDDGGTHWQCAEIYDLSSGGLKLKSHNDYETGDMLLFALTIQGFLSEFDLQVQGIIRRKDKVLAHFLYGIAFMDLSMDVKIRIDENVRNDRPVERGYYEAD